MDKWDPKTGIVASIKSINLRCITYQEPAKLRSLIKRYIDKVAEFRGEKSRYVTIRFDEINHRELDLALPDFGTHIQERILNEIVDYGVHLNVKVNLIPI